MAAVETKAPTLEAVLERVEALERENKILREENALLKQWRFGRSSERLEPGQLHFFEADQRSAEEAEEQDEEPTPRSERKNKRGHGRAVFPKHVPRVDIELDVPEDERVCSCCGGALHPIGEDVSERGHIKPAELIVNRYRRKKYACPHGHEIKSAALPPGVIDGGKYEASVYAHIAVAKYSDHLPLNRMEGIFKRYGVQIPKQTMWDMLVRVDALVAQPVLKQMRKELLEEEILHSDETPVKLRIEGQKGSRDSWVWGWRNVADEGPSKVLIEFHQSRSRDGPLAFLDEWSGTLIIDGYSGYNEVCRRNGIVRAGCWAHARRKFKEALDAGSKDAVGVLRHVRRLFALERAVKGRAERHGMDRPELLELRTRVRGRYSASLIEKIHGTAEGLEAKRSTLPKSKLGKAIQYLTNQREPLEVFLSNPRVPMHNNDEERDLRHIITGRKNWLIFASPRGGEVACRLYSLIISCIQNGVNPQAYIEDVLMAVATTPMSKIASLTPWAWNQARAAEANAT